MFVNPGLYCTPTGSETVSECWVGSRGLAVVGCLGLTDQGSGWLLTCLNSQEVVQLMQQLQQGRLLLGLAELKQGDPSGGCLCLQLRCMSIWTARNTS